MELFSQFQSSSSEDEDTSSEDQDEIIFEYHDSDTFLNQTNKKEYEINRNKLFTKDIVRKHIVFDSHNFYQDINFNSSNYTVPFNHKGNNVFTNYDIYENVIGFRLLKVSIRVPPYNVNATNNVINYTRQGDNTIHTITINPGLYTLTELANVFQTNTPSNNAQYTTYSDSNLFTVSFLDNNSISSSVNKGLIYKFEHNSDFTIKWGTNNITRGASKLFGFFPSEVTSTNNIIHSNKIPDLSSHHVDLVIPEIPSIACKVNSNGKNIIDRIQLDNDNGKYIHNIPELISEQEQYFLPIELSKLTIQLYSENNELYSCNNSDNSFEFEIIMVKNKDLLK